MKILVIDDDKWIRHSLSLFFEYEGCRILTLETAEKALEELEKQAYDIIIADYILPGIDGMEFFKRIQKTHPYTLKILTTACIREKFFSKLKKIGIQALIEKPLTAKAIEQTLSSLVKDYEQKLSDSMINKKEIQNRKI